MMEIVPQLVANSVIAGALYALLALGFNFLYRTVKFFDLSYGAVAALAGAALLVLLPEFLRFVGFPSEIAAQIRPLVYGLILVLLMMYRPQGLLGEYRL